MARLLVLPLLVLLVGCGGDFAANAAPVATEPVVITATVPPPIVTPSPGTALEQAALAAVVADATIADGSLAQTQALHTAYLAQSRPLLQINADSAAEIHMLSDHILPLSQAAASPRFPPAWGCPVALTITALQLAMATAGQVTADAGQDQAFGRDAGWTHATAQQALGAAQRVDRAQGALPLPAEVVAASQFVGQVYGHPVACG